MTRELIIKNIMVNYGKHGIAEQEINALIDSGLAAGQNYDGIYLGLKLAFSKIYGEEFICTSEDVAKAFGVSPEEVNEMVEQCRTELIANGENPDDYFFKHKGSRWLM